MFIAKPDSNAALYRFSIPVKPILNLLPVDLHNSVSHSHDITRVFRLFQHQDTANVYKDYLLSSCYISD